MHLENEANTVEVDLWYTSVIDLGLNFSNELTALADSFSPTHPNVPLFTPRIASFPCKDCGPENCLSGGKYCAYAPRFEKSYGLEEESTHFNLTGREILIQALREKCLHKLMAQKYKNDAGFFWTFYWYLRRCFIEDGVTATSFNECFDWTTVLLSGEEHITELNNCFDSAFEVSGDLDSNNKILEAD